MVRHANGWNSCENAKTHSALPFKHQGNQLCKWVNASIKTLALWNLWCSTPCRHQWKQFANSLMRPLNWIHLEASWCHHGMKKVDLNGFTQKLLFNGWVWHYWSRSRFSLKRMELLQNWSLGYIDIKHSPGFLTRDQCRKWWLEQIMNLSCYTE